jgi:hypothetical protein
MIWGRIGKILELLGGLRLRCLGKPKAGGGVKDAEKSVSYERSATDIAAGVSHAGLIYDGGAGQRFMARPTMYAPAHPAPAQLDRSISRTM